MYIVQEVHVSSDDCGNNVTDAENLKVYVDISDYILKMCERRQIPSALFSELLWLQLLI